ncbi:pyridine nucleotide-disulfide oxidoreductase [Candidatus Heimdallarchaeota archaeon]|nr:MAG: pyridine nucleotide-disulfide oxidoreductase [Candidatus Gerdarchaeota archaeon]RLI72908.1 MAG: pyridine nucleotide-disulfide oxidoreductase [Candidatus Heimdallarchaeota archaeon]
MSEEIRIGVYVCHCGSNIAAIVNCDEVAEYAKSLPHVVHTAAPKYTCSKPSQKRIQEDIKEFNLNRVVVASCSPRQHEETFRRVLEAAGLNKYLFEMANIREHVSWVTDNKEKATTKAKDLVRMAVSKAALLQPLEPNIVSGFPKALVIGGGIAGISSALALADLNIDTILVEKEPTIGGKMAQLDKTFPTQDCSACILTPKMAEVSDHPNITLMTNAEVHNISGYVGNFDVEILKKPRYVDPDKCTACGECVKSCPSNVLSHFDLGLATHKAIYIPFPQAVPQCYTIDKLGIPPCRDGCPADIHVQGYVNLIAMGKFKEALELIREENPFPSVCGKICVGHCETFCGRQKVDDPVAIRALKDFICEYERKELGSNIHVDPIPKKYKEKVAIVGAGPSGLTSAWWLAKHGYHVTLYEMKEKPGGLLQYAIPDYRLPKDVLDFEIQRILDLGVDLKTGVRVGQNADITFNDLRKRGLLRRKGYDAVIISTGAVGNNKLFVEGEDLENVISGIDFLKDVCDKKITKISGKVGVVGGGNTAIDVARVVKRLGASEVKVLYRRSRKEMPAYQEEIDDAIDEGVVIFPQVQIKRIIGENGKVVQAELLKTKLGELGPDGRRKASCIEGSEFLEDFDYLFIAIGQYFDRSIVPEDMIDKHGNLIIDTKTLQSKTYEHIFCCGEFYYSPESVIEAIASGKWAAESVHRYLRGKDLYAGRPSEVTTHSEIYKGRVRIGKVVETIPVERANNIKRHPLHKEPIEARMKNCYLEVVKPYTAEEAMEEASRCLHCANCGVCKECVRACEAQAINHDQLPELVKEKVGAIVVATGYQVFDPRKIPQYHYKQEGYEDIITGLEFERLTNAAGPTEGALIVPSTGKKPKSIAFINCVGSRDKNYHEYCSRYCCTASIKQAILMKSKYGNDIDILLFYKDIRTFGKGYEELYNQALSMGVNFIKGIPSDIRKDVDGSLYFEVYNGDLGKTIRYRPELIVLQTAMEPQEDAKKVGELLSCSMDKDGFFLERHIKLGPVETASAGKFIAGACRGPLDITDSVAQGMAAATMAAKLIMSKSIEKESIIANVNVDICSGCGSCISTCVYGALSLVKTDDGKTRSQVNEILCEGCGACAVTCPSNAITINHFTNEQIEAMIETAFRETSAEAP